MTSSSSSPRAALTVAVVASMLLTLVPGIAVAALPAAVSIEGIPAAVSVGQILDVEIVDTTPDPERVSTATDVRYRLPVSWSLVGDSWTSPSAGGLLEVSQTATDVETGLFFARDGVRNDEFTFRVQEGGQFTTTSGGEIEPAVLVRFQVVVGPDPVGPTGGGPAGAYEVADVAVGSTPDFAETVITPGTDYEWVVPPRVRAGDDITLELVDVRPPGAGVPVRVPGQVDIEFGEAVNNFSLLGEITADRSLPTGASFDPGTLPGTQPGDVLLAVTSSDTGQSLGEVLAAARVWASGESEADEDGPAPVDTAVSAANRVAFSPPVLSAQPSEQVDLTIVDDRAPGVTGAMQTDLVVVLIPSTWSVEVPTEPTVPVLDDESLETGERRIVFDTTGVAGESSPTDVVLQLVLAADAAPGGDVVSVDLQTRTGPTDVVTYQSVDLTVDTAPVEYAASFPGEVQIGDTATLVVTDPRPPSSPPITTRSLQLLLGTEFRVASPSGLVVGDDDGPTLDVSGGLQAPEIVSPDGNIATTTGGGGLIARLDVVVLDDPSVVGAGLIEVTPRLSGGAPATTLLTSTTIVAPGPTAWVVTGGGFAGQGPDAFVELRSDGADGGAVELQYDNISSTGRSITPPITVETTATSAGPVTLPYDFSGFHAFFAVNVRLEAFVTDGEGTETQVLYAPAQQNCCTTPSNGFAATGDVTFALDPGDSYGFRITGSNGDSNNRLRGRLVIGTPLVAQDDVVPEVAVVAAARDLQPQQGPPALDALGRLVGEPDTPYLLTFAGSTADQPQCLPAAELGQPVPVLTNSNGVVDFGASFTDADADGGVLPDRVSVIAVTQLEVVDFGEGFFGTEVARLWDAGNGFQQSNCAFVGFGNDAWTSALELDQTSSGSATPRTFGATDVIEQPGGTRWYRFPVRPNGRATIDLGDLPDDYDLAVFTDIRQEYTDVVNADPDDALNRLGAEFAPSAFSPSAFSPSAFSPSAFSPSAFSPSAFSPSAFSNSVYSPSAFSPSAFSPSAFSPSAFSPSAFSPSAFSPSAFSPSAFSPSAFSPSAFSPSAFSPDETSPSAFSPSAFSPSAFSPSAFSAEAYASAQVQALITLSANEGTADEVAVVNTWNNDTTFYVRVAAKPDVSSSDPFDVTVELEGTTCLPVTRSTLPADAVDVGAGGHQSVIVWDSSRLPGASVDVDTVAARLDDLAAATSGLVIDLGALPSEGRVRALQQQADQNASCVYAANLVAEAVKDLVDDVRPSSPDLQHVVIVGADDVVPFFRYPDTALLGPESDYVPPVDPQSPSEASLRQNYILGQDQYGASTVLSLGGMQVPVPELAVGRLVETPAEIIGMIDQFLDPQDATPTAREAIRPQSTLVTGYDFMTDAAEAIQEDFTAGTSGAPAQVNDALIAPANQAPGDPDAWTGQDLFDAFLAPPQKHDLVYLAGHFSANSALAADYQTQVVTTEIAPSGVDLAGSVVFSNGCHSGYNIVDGEGIDGLTLGLDWAQALAQQRATLIGGTGYQYGDTDLVEYSERLYANFAQELRRGTGDVAVGEALVRAKLDYLATTPDPRGLHRKSLLISTVFGLPMTSVDMPGERLLDDGPTGGVMPEPITDGPGGQLGLERSAVTLSAELTERTKELEVLDDDGTPIPSLDRTGSYLVGPDTRTAVQPNEPILPLLNADVTVGGTSLRGVAFRGGTYTDTPGVTPLSSAAGTELRGVHVPFSSEVFFPMRLATANYYDALGGGRTRLLATPVQHRVDQVGDETATRRVFDELDLQLYYSDNVETYDVLDGDGAVIGTRTPSLSSPPQIAGVRFNRVLNAAGAPTDDVLVDVKVVGDPAAGIQEVWIVTTARDGSGTGTWDPVDLVNDPDDTRRWSAVLPNAAAASAPPLDVVVQAVNGVGLVSTDDNLGRYYRTGGSGVLAPGEEPLAPEPTTLQIGAATPAAPVVGQDVTIPVTLRDGLGVGLPGQRVLVTFGSGGRTVVTGADGRASATFPATAAVGPTSVTARFRGDADALLAQSTASSSVAVGRAATTLSGLARADGSVLLRLVDELGRSVPEVSLFLDIAPGTTASGVADTTRITDQAGQLLIPASVIAADQAAVGAVFQGTATLEGSTVSIVPAPAAPVEPTLSSSLIALGGSTTVTASLASLRDAQSATATATDSFGNAVTFAGTFDGVALEVSAELSGLPAGVYEVTMQVAGPDLASPQSAPTMLVVFDPDGGSVSGAGWLVPQPDDVLPSFTGIEGDRANFGFNVRYKRGRDVVPAGNARFRYRAGGLDLDASEFEWLAVTNRTGGIFRGQANVTIDGEDPTGEPWTFQIDVRDRNDGDDEFGIKIWRPSLDPDTDEPTYRVARNVIGGGTVNVKSR